MNNKQGSTGSPQTYRGRFPKDHQLDDSLEIVDKQICRRVKAGKIRSSGNPPTLPGHPTKCLDNNVDNIQDLEAFLCKEFDTPRLDRMAPKLWVLTTTNHANIPPLHENMVRGRHIVVTENPELHLTWIDDKVFIKPIPPYLVSHAFWERYLISGPSSPLQHEYDKLLPAILGYLRSWTYLVRYESDFSLAKKANLIPRGASHTSLLRFLSYFDAQSVQDSDVSPRYRYGQMRLSRLNFWVKIFLHEEHFEQVYWQYWQYFQTFYAPLLFIFAVFTVVLSAMQVGMTAPDIWPAFSAVSVWFSVATLIVIAVTVVALVLLFLYKSLKEIIFALSALGRRKSP